MQSDPLEQRFSVHRQMSDGRFLVGLGGGGGGGLNSENNCFTKDLAERKHFWEDVGNDICNDNIDNMEVIKQHVAAGK